MSTWGWNDLVATYHMKQWKLIISLLKLKFEVRVIVLITWCLMGETEVVLCASVNKRDRGKWFHMPRSGDTVGAEIWIYRDI